MFMQGGTYTCVQTCLCMGIHIHVCEHVHAWGTYTCVNMFMHGGTYNVCEHVHVWECIYMHVNTSMEARAQSPVPPLEAIPLPEMVSPLELTD